MEVETVGKLVDMRPRTREGVGRLEPKPPRALETDVLVSGAGIPGLTAAVLLARAGKTVAVLPRSQDGLQPLSEVAVLTQRLGTSFAALLREHGLDMTRAVASSTRHAMETVRVFGRAMGGCGYRRISGYLVAEAVKDLQELREECDAASAAGLHAELERKLPLQLRNAGAARFPGQAQFMPTAYLLGLRRLAQKAGVQILPRARIESLVEGEPCVVRTATDLKLRAASVFLAAQQPFIKFPFLAGLVPQRRDLVTIARGAEVRPALFWNASVASQQMHPAVQDGKETLVIGFDDCGTGTGALLQAVLSRLGKTILDVLSTDSTTVMRPLQGLPLIGRRRPHSPVFIATGFGDNIFTLGTLAALAVTDTILGRPARWWEASAPLATRPAEVPQLACSA